MNSSRRRLFGFTLVELLLSIGILGFISIFVTNLIKKSIKRSDRLSARSERIDQVRASFDLMSKDLNKALHAQDILIHMYNQAEKKLPKKYEELKKIIADHNKKKPTEAKKLPPKPIVKKYAEKTLSFFEGASNKLNFTSLNSMHFQKSQDLSDQVEIGYFLDDCNLYTRAGKRRSTQCLWRRQSAYVDDKFDEGGTSTILLTDITEMELKYLNFESDGKDPKWEANWSSQESPQENTKEKFPLAVKLILKTSDPKDDKNIQTYQAGFRLNFPNNWEAPKDVTAPVVPPTPPIPGQPGLPPGGTGTPAPPPTEVIPNPGTP